MSIAHKNLFIAPSWLIFIIFLVLKLNKNIDWLWSIIFIPLWLIFLLILTWTCYYSIYNENFRVHLIRSNIYVQLYTIMYICLLFFAIVLTLQLDDVIKWDWFIIFIPLWVIFCMWIYWWYNTHRKPIENTSLDTSSNHQSFTNNTNPYHPNLIYHDVIHPTRNLEEKTFIEFGFTLKTYQFIISIGFIVFFIFLPLQLDLTNKWNWICVFIPLWVSLAIWFWSLLSYTIIKTNYVFNTNTIYDVPLWIELFIYYILCISWILFSVLMVVHLNGKSMDYLTLFIPLLACFMIIFFICFSYINYNQKKYDNQHIKNLEDGSIIQFN